MNVRQDCIALAFYIKNFISQVINNSIYLEMEFYEDIHSMKLYENLLNSYGAGILISIYYNGILWGNQICDSYFI